MTSYFATNTKYGTLLGQIANANYHNIYFRKHYIFLVYDIIGF